MSGTKDYSVIIEKLTAGYEKKNGFHAVLRDASFNIEPGKLICLMGPNGAGKSTLLRTIAGLQPLHSGNVIINRKNIADLSSKQLATELSVVLTEQIAIPHMTVKELLAMGRYPHLSWLLKFSEDDDIILKETAKACGIEALLSKNIQELSDGQRQKVLIARALVQDSAILILDEPTSHLDLNNRVEIINLLKNVSREGGKTIIMATHELDLALQMADRLLLLNNRGELFQGIPEDLVLNGLLDEVFSFKGYDLKTGRVQHHNTGRKVSLKGKGYAYLWSKNALEREGFEISEDAEIEISILNDEKSFSWKKGEEIYHSLYELLDSMIKKDR